MEAEICDFTRGSATVRYSSAAQKSSFLTLKHSRRLQRFRNGCSREPIDSLLQVITERKMRALRGDTLHSSSLLHSTLFFFLNTGERGSDRKTGSKAVSHSDMDSDVVKLRHYLIQPPSSYLGAFSSLSSPWPYTKLSACWTFRTIYVGQGQDHLNCSASLSPCR